MAGSDPLSVITFALGKLEHTLPRQLVEEALPERRLTTAGVEAVECFCGALCNSSQDLRELGVPRRRASLSLHTSTVTVAGCRSGVTEGSPARLLCEAALFAMIVCRARGTGYSVAAVAR